MMDAEANSDFLTTLRMATLRKHISFGARSLEIGAFCRPTLSRPMFRAHFVDYFSTKELREQCKHNGEDPQNVVNVDFVVKGEDYTSSVQGKFQIVIANHVWEHITNPIKWLNMIGELTDEDGILFISLPDKRFSFDCLRDETSLAHILSDYLVPGRDLTAEHCIETEIYYDRKYVGQKRSIEGSLSIDAIINSFKHHHPGIHCHVFNGDNFLAKIMEPIIYMKLVPWSVVDFAQEHRAGEFYTVLRKGPPVSRLKESDFFDCLTEKLRPTS